MLLAAFAGCCILLSLGRLYASNLGTLAFTMIVGPLACCAVGLIAFGTDLFSHWEFRLLIGILAVVFLSSMISEKFYGTFAQNRNDLFTLITLLFVCYSLCFALPKERRLPVLNALVDLSGLVVGIVALVGVVLAVCGQYVMPAFMPEYGIGLCPADVGMGADGRLVLFTHPNSVGMICEIVLLLNVYRLLCAKRPLVRWLHGACGLICFLALALAASRTATIAAAGGLALFAFRLLYLRLAGKSVWKRWCVSLISAAAVLVLAYLVNVAACDLMLAIAPVDNLSDAAVTAAERNILEDIGMFTGRTNIWAGALQAMKDLPRLFLIGTSPINVGLVVSPYSPIYAQELHNSFMQMLVSGGVLCPLLFFAFLILLFVHGLKLYFASPARSGGKIGSVTTIGLDAAGGAGYLIIPLAAILINACMETFLLIYPQLAFASVWFFLLAGFVVCISKETTGGKSAA